MIRGIHHITALTSSRRETDYLMTEILRLTPIQRVSQKQEMNKGIYFYGIQNDLSGGFLAFKQAPNDSKAPVGTNRIRNVSLQVAHEEILGYFLQRFEDLNVKHQPIIEVFDKLILPFQWNDGIQYQLVARSKGRLEPIDQPISYDEPRISGLGPLVIDVAYYQDLLCKLEDLYGFGLIQADNDQALLELGSSNQQVSILLNRQDKGPQAPLGPGPLPQLAFKVADERALKDWWEYYQEASIRSFEIEDDDTGYRCLSARMGHFTIKLVTE